MDNCNCLGSASICKIHHDALSTNVQLQGLWKWISINDLTPIVLAYFSIKENFRSYSEKAHKGQPSKLADKMKPLASSLEKALSHLKHPDVSRDLNEHTGQGSFTESLLEDLSKTITLVRERETSLRNEPDGNKAREAHNYILLFGFSALVPLRTNGFVRRRKGQLTLTTDARKWLSELFTALGDENESVNVDQLLRTAARTYEHYPLSMLIADLPEDF